jgi:hypothetical protein
MPELTEILTIAAFMGVSFVFGVFFSRSAGKEKEEAAADHEHCQVAIKALREQCAFLGRIISKDLHVAPPPGAEDEEPMKRIPLNTGKVSYGEEVRA